jgi:hypothetical protein
MASRTQAVRQGGYGQGNAVDFWRIGFGDDGNAHAQAPRLRGSLGVRIETAMTE